MLLPQTLNRLRLVYIFICVWVCVCVSVCVYIERETLWLHFLLALLKLFCSINLICDKSIKLYDQMS